MAVALRQTTTRQGFISTLNPAATFTTHSEGASGGTAAGPVIANTDGTIRQIFAQLVTSGSGGGSSPTAQLALKGSLDGTNFSALVDSSGNAITSGSATSVSSAAVVTLDTASKGVTFFPPYLRIDVVIGGTSTPSFTGVLCEAFMHRAANRMGGQAT